jgi:hypothetical protein
MKTTKRETGKSEGGAKKSELEIIIRTEKKLGLKIRNRDYIVSFFTVI